MRRGSPVTWARYLGTPRGDVYGYIPSTWDGMFPRVQCGHKEDFPKEKKGDSFSLTVVIRGEKQTVPCKTEESLLWAMERAGIKAPSHCRSGECGWCHSRLISGDVYIPEDADGRRLADKKFGWVHPCCTFPLGDIELEVFPIS